MDKLNIQSRINHLLATMTKVALFAVLMVCANTTSCTMIHQPEAPEELNRFSKIK